MILACTLAPAAWRSSPPCGGPRRGSAGWRWSGAAVRRENRNSRAPVVRVHYDEGFGVLFDRTPRREARAAGHGEAR